MFPMAQQFHQHRLAQPPRSHVVTASLPNQASTIAIHSQAQPSEKRHVSGGLKFLADEKQRAQALEAAEVWKKRFAEEAKWEEVVGSIGRFANEDHVRIPRGHRQAQVIPARRRLLLSSSAPLTAPTGAQRLRPAHIAHIKTDTPPTLRPRWDVLLSSPISPLSPSPMGNAFASGGFWESLTPKTPQPATPVPQTPITAIAPDPWSPVVPEDPEAKAVYDEVKKDVDNVALKLCASRLSVHPAFNNANDVLHRSMVKPRDELHGAEFVLESRQTSLRKHLNTELPEKMERFAGEEAVAHRQHSIKNDKELLDVDYWLEIDEKTFEPTTILDAQRELFRMNRNRRKSKELQLSDQALQLAWATKILDDTECMVEIKGDGSSTYSDEDQGYDYSNFLRSIKRDVSSMSDLASTLDEKLYGDIGSLRSSATTTDLAPMITPGSREASFSVGSRTSAKKAPSSLTLRASTSPKKPSHSDLPLRLREGNSESQSLMRRNNTTSKTRELSITTSIHEESDQTESPELSPEQKEFRRQGPSFAELTNWAQELKKMEDKRRELKQARNADGPPGLRHQRHPAFRSSHRRREGGSTGSSYTLRTEDASKNAAGHEKQSSTLSTKSDFSKTSTSSTQHDENLPTPPPLSLRSPKRSKSFSTRDQLTGLIPLPPSRYNREASTSHERRALSSTIPHPSLPPSITTSSTPPTQHHQTTPNNPSLRNELRRTQHVRSQSCVSVPSVVEDVDDWTKELKRMESRERVRQMGEREKVVRDLEGKGEKV